MIRRASFPRASFHNDDILPGRILGTTIDVGGGIFRCMNIHNFGVPLAVLKHLATIAAATIPTIRAPLLPAGTIASAADAADGAVCSATSRRSCTAKSTRFAWRHRGTPQEEVLQSALDWTAVSLPASPLARTTVIAQVYPQALACDSGPTPLSNHAPVITTFEARRRAPASQRPVRTWVVRHPLYAVNATRLLRRAPYDAHPSDRRRHTKQLIRTAAAATRNMCLAKHPTSRTARAQLAVQVVRARHDNDGPAWSGIASDRSTHRPRCHLRRRRSTSPTACCGDTDDFDASPDPAPGPRPPQVGLRRLTHPTNGQRHHLGRCP